MFKSVITDVAIACKYNANRIVLFNLKYMYFYLYPQSHYFWNNCKLFLIIRNPF